MRTHEVLSEELTLLLSASDHGLDGADSTGPLWHCDHPGLWNDLWNEDHQLTQGKTKTTNVCCTCIYSCEIWKMDVQQFFLQIGVNTGGKKKAIWMDCGIHAREWIAPAFCQYFVRQVTQIMHLKNKKKYLPSFTSFLKFLLALGLIRSWMSTRLRLRCRRWWPTWTSTSRRCSMWTATCTLGRTARTTRSRPAINGLFFFFLHYFYWVLELEAIIGKDRIYLV